VVLIGFNNVSKENHTFRNIAFNQLNIITKAASIKNELNRKMMYYYSRFDTLPK